MKALLFEYSRLFPNWNSHARIATGNSHAMAIVLGPNAKLSLCGWGENSNCQIGSSTEGKQNDIRVIELAHEKKVYTPLQVAACCDFSVAIAAEFKLDDNAIDQSSGKRKKRFDSVIDEPDFVIEEGIKLPKTALFIFGRVRSNKTSQATSRQNLSRQDLTSESFLSNPTFQVITKIAFKQVDCGSNFIAAISSDDSLYVWGDGQNGCLGNGSYESIDEPQKVNFDGNLRKRISFVACGFQHIGVITTTDEAYFWGVGSSGQLGLGTKDVSSVPKRVKELYGTTLLSLACGRHHSMALVREGRVFAFGSNKNGQLGLGDFDDRTVPTEVSKLQRQDVRRVACGANQTFFVTVKGEVFACGNNRANKLGLLSRDLLDKNVKTPEPVHLRTDDNGREQTHSIFQVSTSSNFTMALSTHGSLLTWGINAFGVLGRAENAETMLPGAIPGIEFFVGNRMEDEPSRRFPLVMSKRADSTEEVSSSSSTQLIDVKCGWYHTVALTDGGEVIVCGANSKGQHGMTTAAKECWLEQNRESIRFTSSCEAASLVPSFVPAFDIQQKKPISAIASGAEFILALDRNRNLYSWGANDHGQLGIGKFTPFECLPARVAGLLECNIKAICCGDEHSLIMTEDGRVLSCGNFRHGRLGQGFLTADLAVFKEVAELDNVCQIAAGYAHNIALVRVCEKGPKGVVEKSTLFSWGHGLNGKLGLGDELNAYMPKAITFPGQREQSISLTNIACGREHSIAVSKEGQLYVWGARDRLFLEEEKKEYAMNSQRIQTPSNSVVVPTKFYNKALLKSKFKSIELGNYLTVARSLDGQSLFKWGYFDSELTVQNKADRLREMNLRRVNADPASVIAVGPNHGAYVATGGVLLTWGSDNNTGRLGHSADLTTEGRSNMKRETFDPYAFVSEPMICDYVRRMISRMKRSREESSKAKTRSDGLSRSPIFGMILMSKSRPFGQEEGEQMSQQMKRAQTRHPTLNSEMLSSPDMILSRMRSDVISSNMMPEEDKRYKSLADDKRLLAFYEDKQSILTRILEFYSALARLNKRKRNFVNHLKNVLTERIADFPFCVRFTTTVIRRELYSPEFHMNYDAYKSFLTMLQLHPCYLLKALMLREWSPQEFAELVNQIYGADFLINERKAALFFKLASMILEVELSEAISNGDRHLRLDFYSAVEPSAPSSGEEVIECPVFLELFLLVVRREIANRPFIRMFSNVVLKRVEAYFEVTGKLIFKFPFLIREVDEVRQRYQLTEQRLCRIASCRDRLYADSAETRQTVRQELDAFVRDLTSAMKKVCVQIDREKDNTSLLTPRTQMMLSIFAQRLRTSSSEPSLEDFVENKVLSLAFLPVLSQLYQTVYHARSFPFEEDAERVDYLLFCKTLNTKALADIFHHLISGEGKFLESVPQECYESLTKEVNSVNESRSKMAKALLQQQKNIETELIRTTFIHSAEVSNDRITIQIGELARLTRVFRANMDDLKSASTLQRDKVHQALESMKPDLNYWNTIPEPTVASTRVNISLRTRQLIYSQRTALKVCRFCGACLNEALLDFSDLYLIHRYSPPPQMSASAILPQVIKADKRLKMVIREGGINAYEQLVANRARYSDDPSRLKDLININNLMEVVNQRVHTERLERGVSEALPLPEAFGLILGDVFQTYQNDKQRRCDYAYYIESRGKLLKGILEWLPRRVSEFKTERAQEALIETNCQLGLGNREFEKLLGNDHTSVVSRTLDSFKRKPIIDDLFENLDETEKESMSSYGKYSTSFLKQHGILLQIKPDEEDNGSREFRSSDIAPSVNPSYFIFVDDSKGGLICDIVSEIQRTNQAFSLKIFQKEQKIKEVVDSFQITEDNLNKLRVSRAEKCRFGIYEFKTNDFLRLLDHIRSSATIYKNMADCSSNN